MLIQDALNVFRKGQMVANPALWKNIGATSSLLAGLITSGLAVATAFGYRIDVDSHLVEALASGIAAALFIVSGGLHIATSDKVGLPAKPVDQQPGNPAADDAGDRFTNPDRLGS